MTSNRPLLGIAIATVLLTAVTIWMLFVRPDSDRDLPKRWDSPLIALQLSTSAAEVERIASQRDSDSWRRLDSTLFRDYFFAIAYGLLFVFHGMLLRRRRGFLGAMGWVAIVGAVLTVYFDFRENSAARDVLRGSTDFASMSWNSLAKWGMAGVTSLSLAFLFPRPLPLEHRVKLYGWFIWFLYTLAGVILLYGAFLETEHYALQHGMQPLILAIVCQTLLWIPRANRDRFLATL